MYIPSIYFVTFLLYIKVVIYVYCALLEARSTHRGIIHVEVEVEFHPGPFSRYWMKIFRLLWIEESMYSPSIYFVTFLLYIKVVIYVY